MNLDSIYIGSLNGVEWIAYRRSGETDEAFELRAYAMRSRLLERIEEERCKSLCNERSKLLFELARAVDHHGSLVALFGDTSTRARIEELDSELERLRSPVSGDAYQLTSDELSAVSFARGRYVWADLVAANTDERGVLTLDNCAQHEVWDALEAEGLPLLCERSELARFLWHLEPV